MNLNNSLPPTMETLRAFIIEGAALFYDPASDFETCARRYVAALFEADSPNGALIPDGVYTNPDGETAFFFDPPELGSPNADRAIRWVQGAHAKVLQQMK
jgi:hypothetical protein